MGILHLIFTEEIGGELFPFTLLFGEKKRFGNQFMRITNLVTNCKFLSCAGARFRGTETHLKKYKWDLSFLFWPEFCLFNSEVWQERALLVKRTAPVKQKTNSHIC